MSLNNVGFAKVNCSKQPCEVRLIIIGEKEMHVFLNLNLWSRESYFLMTPLQVNSE